MLQIQDVGNDAVCYAFVVLFSRSLFVNFYRFVVHLVGGSFAFLVKYYTVERQKCGPK